MFKAQIETIKQARRKNIDATDAFFQIRRTGRKVEVADAFRQVSDFDPSWVEAQYQYGLALFRLGRQKDAIPHFQMCAYTHPEWMPALNHLALCHLKVGNASLGLSVLKSVLDLDPDDDVFEYSKAFEVLADEYFKYARKERSKSLRDGIVSELKKVCELDVERNGERAWSSLYLGAIRYYHNDIDGALLCFERAAFLADPYRANYPIVHKSAFGCFSLRTLESTREIFLKPELKDESVVLGASCDTDLVYLLGCDEGYFKRFSEFSISSICKTNNNLVVHFHIIGRRESVTAEILKVDEVAKASENVQVRYSFEDKPDDATVTYYAISRFLIAHKIIKHYSSDVIIGDIDSAVVGSLRSVQSYVGECDVGVNAATDADAFRKYPWNSISGGYMFFGNSRLGVSYAENLSKFMGQVYDSSSIKSWWLDQSSLFSVTHYHAKFEVGFKLRSFVSSSAPQPFIHNPAGKSKDEFAQSVMDMIRSGEFVEKYLHN